MALHEFLVLLLCLHTTEGDFSLSRMLSFNSVNIYEKASKKWHVYIKAFLHHHTQNAFSSVTVSQQMSDGWEFQSMASRRIPFVLHKMVCVSRLFVQKVNETVKNPNITEASLSQINFAVVLEIAGYISHTDILYTAERSFPLPCIRGDDILPIFESSFGWLLFITDRLRVNILFQLIHIPQRSVRNCNTASVLVLEERVYTQPNETMMDPFVFCGHHSTFNLFPSFSKVQIVLLHSIVIKPKVLAFFSMIDQNVAHNVPFSEQMQQRPVYYVSLRENEQITVYSIVVEKIFFIVVNVSQFVNKSFTIFDGPGVSAPVIVPQKNLYATSTFQCVLLKFSTTIMVAGRYMFVSYKATQLEISQEVDVQPNPPAILFVLDSKQCLSPIVIQAKVEERVRMNATVKQLSFIGPNSNLCTYGGIVGVDVANNEYQEILTLCEPFEETHGQGRSVYSKSAMLILVFYWYKEYAEVSLTLQFAQTKCQSVRLDPCVVVERCKMSAQTDLCEPYLAEISGLSSINLYQDLDYTVEPGDLAYSLKRDNCTVLQISQGRGASAMDAMEHCYVKFEWHPTVRSTERETNHEIRGSMKLSSLVPDCISFGGYMDVKLNEKSKHEQADCYEMRKFTSTNIPNTRNFRSFHVRIRNSKSAFMEGLTFDHVGFYGYSHSWIDIAVWVSQAQTCSRFKYHFNTLSMSHQIDAAVLQEKDYVLIVKEISPSERTASQTYVILSICAQIDNFAGDRAAILQEPTHNDSHILHWQSTLMFLNSTEGYDVSVPGKYNDVSLHFETGTYLSTRHVLEMIWVDDRYIHLQQKYFQVYCDVMVEADTYCLNYSGVLRHRTSEKYYVFLGKQFEEKGNTMSPIGGLKSWKTASETCHVVGGSLAMFTSSEDSEEFVAFFKVFKHIPFGEAFYIGLSSNDTGMVRNVFCCQAISL